MARWLHDQLWKDKFKKKDMTNNPILSLVVYFAMIFAVFYFASKGWSEGK